MRPGGLTALAVFNFVFGGLETLGQLLSLATLSAFYEKMSQHAREMGEAFPSLNVLYAVALFAIVRGGLLIWSGVGYLGMRRVSGRMLGNAYALAALVGLALEITLTPQKFTAFSLVGFVYPLITLFMLNAVFRKDLIR